MEILVRWIRIIINVWLLVMIYYETGIYTTIFLSIISITNEIRAFLKEKKKQETNISPKSKWAERLKEMQETNKLQTKNKIK